MVKKNSAMTEYTGKVRSHLVSVEEQLRHILSAVDEEDIFVSSLKEELSRLDSAEADRTDAAGDRILSVVRTSRDEKLAATKADLETAAADLTRRWQAAEKKKKILKSQNEAKDAQFSALLEQLTRLRAARRGEAEAFDRRLEAGLAKAMAAAGKEEADRRKQTSRKVATTIMAVKKRPECRAPMSEMMPIDRSVSRIYQQMSYLVHGPRGAP